jgi:aspartate ammonia-lyase
VHPNDHVNMAQSTNDTIPTAIRLAAISSWAGLQAAIEGLAQAFDNRAQAFDGIVKTGRTHLQDATPIRLGQEFAAYAGSARRGADRIAAAVDALHELNIGGSAVGTGLNVEPGYPRLMVERLSADTGAALRVARDPVQLMQSMGDVVALSGALRTFAVDLSKIANDIRLLASGPRTGLGEITVPVVQPGSSIMPGKVNPVIAEMVNMVCFQVVGNDTTVAIAGEAGQLELNVMMPVMAHNVLLSMRLLTNATRVFADRCVSGITANLEQIAHWLERSPALVTALAPQIGYEAAAALAKEAVARGVTVRELVEEKGLLSAEAARDVFDLRRMTEPGVPGQHD